MRSRCSVLLPFLVGCGSNNLSAPTKNDSVPPDGTGISVHAARLVPVLERGGSFRATALDFNPTREGELWVTLKQPPVDAPCTPEVGAGCSALIGQVAVIDGATGTSPQAQIKQDGNAWHFMRRPTGIAFGEDETFATCGEARTANYTDEVANYIGPTLWSSDPTIFGVKPEPGQNGTHLDMLHESPFCMGIAHERGNAYWVFNGERGALDRYDFKLPHVIGGDDHADGELYRHLDGMLARVPELPSHLAVDAERGLLYVADTGNARVLRVEIASGTPGLELVTLDRIAVRVLVTDTSYAEFGPSGLWTLPSGVALTADRIYVSDNASGSIHVLDRDGEPVERIDTDLPPGALSGITMGPDGKLYTGDLTAARAYRIEIDP